MWLLFFWIVSTDVFTTLFSDSFSTRVHMTQTYTGCDYWETRISGDYPGVHILYCSISVSLSYQMSNATFKENSLGRQICFLQPSFLSWSGTQPCICPHVLMHKIRVNFYTFMGGGKNQWDKPQSSAVAYKVIHLQWVTVLLFYFPVFSLGSIFPNPLC